MFTFKTIRDGERVALWDRDGRVEFVSGPRRSPLPATPPGPTSTS